MPGVTSDGDGWAESDLLRFVVEVVNVPVQSHGTDRLQREILLRPHLRQKDTLDWVEEPRHPFIRLSAHRLKRQVP